VFVTSTEGQAVRQSQQGVKPDVKMPVARDVAERVGVSTATVSRVLNGSSRVRPETREAVLKAAAEIGFLVNGAARALTTRRFSTVGAIVPNLENDVFVRALATFQSGLRRGGYTLFVSSSSYEMATELNEATFLMERGVDGLMLVGDIHSDELYACAERYNIPLIQSFSLSSRRNCVGFDNAAAAQKATNYLLDLGHKRLAIVTGTRKDNDRSGARVRGVREALQQRGLDLPPQHDLVVSHGVLAGRDAARQLLSSNADRPTAILCGTDDIAIGLISEAQGLGLSVPADLSVIGFNDSYYAGVLTPALTTLRVHADEIGRVASERLISMMAGEATVRLTNIEAELIIRDTTAPPRAL